MKVTQIAIGRFWHFHLARQMEKHGLLNKIYTGYPRFKLKDEKGIPSEKIKTFPWVQAPFMMRGSIGLGKWEWLSRELAWLAHVTIDRYVADRIEENSILVAMSNSGLYSGKSTQQKGGKYICDRGSSHIRFQNDILTEEYAKWGLPFKGIDERSIIREEAEYEQADRITVPSEFVRKSFISLGVPEEKITKVVYGARLDRFSRVGEPDKGKFIVLWVGGVSVRKGFMYLVNAFKRLKHQNKEMWVVGKVSADIAKLLETRQLDHVKFLGIVPNIKLSEVYNSATVFVLPSLEEGLAMVQGEALACGCPIISSTNSGAEDLITHGREGFIIPIRSEEAILECFQQFLDKPSLRGEMSDAALKRVRQLGGWDEYGSNFAHLVRSL